MFLRKLNEKKKGKIVHLQRFFFFVSDVEHYQKHQVNRAPYVSAQSVTRERVVHQWTLYNPTEQSADENATNRSDTRQKQIRVSDLGIQSFGQKFKENRKIRKNTKESIIHRGESTLARQIYTNSQTTLNESTRRRVFLFLFFWSTANSCSFIKFNFYSIFNFL